MIVLEKISYSVEDKNIFSKKSKSILDNISFEIKMGEIVGLIGESGAGKTTLAKVVSGVLQKSSGTIKFNSIEQDEIQILFQNSLELINPLRKIRNILDDSLLQNSTQDISYFLDQVNLPYNILDKFGYQISGGERQRIGLARILIASPKLLILDEPFSAQDPNSQQDFVNLFERLNKELGLTILCVSHELNIMSSFPHKLGVMKNGELVEFGLTSEVVNNAKHDYTKFLFRAKDFALTLDDFH